MQYRRMGKTGLQLSAFGLGSWVTFGKQVQLSDACELLKTAYDAGINFFDNAEGYEAGESEKIMGDAIHSLGLSRDTYVVSSKVFWGGNKPTQLGLSAKHVRDACDAALKRLRVDYLDLYYCHRPDVDTPIEETVRAMHNLILQGKVIYWGTSEWSAEQITEAYLIAKLENLTPPSVEQPQYNMLERKKMDGEYHGVFNKYGIGSTTFSPLASGLLTGKYLKGIPENSRLNLPDYAWLKESLFSGNSSHKIEQLHGLAKDHGITLTHLSLLWCLQNPHVSSVILGASRKEQLTSNLEALKYQDKLTPTMMKGIEAILKNKPQSVERFK